MSLARDVNGLRAARDQLEAQVEAQADTRWATYAEARRALAEVDAELRELEAQARETLDCAYLFKRRR